MATGTIVRDMPPPPEEERPAATTDVSKTFSTTEQPPATAAATLKSIAATPNDLMERSAATLSNPWEFDIEQPVCMHCRDDFNLINRRHHCRLCGKVFCGKCSDQRALIPPSAIVLTPKGGKKALPPNMVNKHGQGFHLPSHQEQQQAQQEVSFSPDEDPDRMLTYVDDEQQLLYGKGLEERFQLAREPLRVCLSCHEQLQPLQAELRAANSNAMRFNHIDPTDPLRRFLNSPLAFTLGHEVRKASYALNNLLPMPKRVGSVIEAVNSDNDPDTFLTGDARDLQQCKDECSTIAPNFSNLDGVRVPARLLEQAKGVAVMTVVKGGFGLAGLEFGTGLVVARLGDDQQWSAPCAIGTAGVSWGALIGAQISDHVFLLMTDAAVELMFNNNGNLQLGADVGVAVGPLGRALEADIGAAPGSFAPIYTYSMSKGLYAGISLDGKVIVTRNRVNERFYGREVTGPQFLSGEIPSPPAARPLYDALHRCHVYATGNMGRGGSGSVSSYFLNRPKSHTMQGFPEVPPQYMQQQYPGSDDFMTGPTLPQQPLHPLEDTGVMPPASNDQHSYSVVSDITSDPGF